MCSNSHTLLLFLMNFLNKCTSFQCEVQIQNLHWPKDGNCGGGGGELRGGSDCMRPYLDAPQLAPPPPLRPPSLLLPAINFSRSEAIRQSVLDGDPNNRRRSACGGATTPSSTRLLPPTGDVVEFGASPALIPLLRCGRLIQELVLGCTKITGKAVMLDEIINYVQSLQQQVEFLSMKLAYVNPNLNFDVEQILSKEILQSWNLPYPGKTLNLPYRVSPSSCLFR